MKETLRPGDVHRLVYKVGADRTVPALYPESPEFAAMPAVFATGYMVGLMEWACMEALRPHLDEGEGSLGVGICVTHVAPTPPGMAVTVVATCQAVDGRRVAWHVRAEDARDVIGEGTHDRAIVTWDSFRRRVEAKAACDAG